ncbi:MAG TPA: glycosyltransferase family A protein [Burkholderiales bacterium]|nr:glycosyltransferase family A protein [Burkholderiales bacterium]
MLKADTERDGPNVPVSVVIPCYCCADTLARAVESVWAQTRPPAELVLVDDASPDGGATRRAIESVRGNAPSGVELKTVWLPRNAGPGGARNAGWDAATQPLVAFLDADDAWHPRKLEIQTALMSEDSNITLSGHGTFVAAQGRPFPALPEHWTVTLVRPARLLVRNLLPTRTVMLRRDVMLRFEEAKRYCEDYHLWLRLVLGGKAARRIELPLACSFKPDFGAAGLSGRLWEMEKGELDAYARLRREGLLSPWTYPGVAALSLLKYSIRSAHAMLPSHAAPDA